MNEQVLSTILGIATTFITGLITVVLLPAIAKWLSAKTDNQNLNNVIMELSHTVQTSVDYINQTFVDQLKIDGKFDVDAQKEALQLAIDDVFNNISENTKNILGKDGIDIEGIIIRYIEGYINNSSYRFPSIGMLSESEKAESQDVSRFDDENE